MALASMLEADEEAVICDLAETYQIYNYRELPARYLAVLVTGLRADSRIKMKMTGTTVPNDLLLMASVADSLRLLLWSFGSKGEEQPKSLVAQLLGEDIREDQVSFDSPEAFEQERKRILERVKKNGK